MIYVASDLHGQYNFFIKMLERIALQDKDTLYILGDIIDRGSQGIRIIQKIRRSNNIVLLIGNHELLFLQAIRNQPSILEKTCTDTLVKISEWMYWLTLDNICDNWLTYNGGRETLLAFLELPKNERIEIVKFLMECPIAVPDLKVNDKLYYLVHAMPCLAYTNQIVTYKESNEKISYNMVWKRKEETGYSLKIKGHTAIIGHTITKNFYKKKPLDIEYQDMRAKIYYGDTFIAIDCGCAYRDSLMQFACICLDNGKEYYVNSDDIEEWD